MFRALYAHKSKLPKYLSFEAGDKFTLIDTSVSDQWFLAQNGLGEIGYVPFNYIKKIEATTDQLVKFIDGAIEAIHLQAGDGDSYTQEQRLCLKKLVKHRSDVIKRATLRDKSPKGASKRRPAPAPPVEKSSSIDICSAGDKIASLAVVGRSATISAPSSSSSTASKHTESTRSEDRGVNHSKQGDTKSLHRSSIATDSLSSKDDNDKRDLQKSRSVTNSIGQAPSIVSSASSMSTDIDGDTETLSEAFVDAETYNSETSSTGSGEIETSSHKDSELSSEESRLKGDNDITEQIPVDSDTSSEVMPSPPVQESNNTTGTLSQEERESSSQSEKNLAKNSICDDPVAHQNMADGEQIRPASDLVKNLPDDNLLAQGQDSGAASSSLVENGFELDPDDLPPPPPDLDPGCVEDDESYFYSAYSYNLPPAPDDLLTSDGDDGMEESVDSDSLDLPAAKAIRECSCEDQYPTFDVDGHFPASGALSLPAGRQMDLKTTEKRDVETAHQFLASSAVLSSSSTPIDVEQREKELERLERLQAYAGVTVTHADCEEMIGQFQRVSNLSHEESHWALVSAMSLFAHKVPHLKPSMEMMALRFNMGHQCPSTGQGYQCEDARTLEGLVSQLDAVMNDSQQRGHYLADDLDDIIDIITTLSDTLSKAKRCVSVAAIQKDNYAMVEVIAKYYQMETRWLIHSCLLQLVEEICHLHPQAITEFLYSQLPLELVAEMQQHSNDDIRFLQVARALGIVFMKAKASPHRLAMVMDLHFFIWLLGMIEGFNERGHHSDVEMLVALVCSYHLQHRDDAQNPVTEALKMAHGHALLQCALSFLSKHGDPTRLLNSGVVPKVNSVVLLLTHLYDSSDTSDLLYTNDVDALVGIFQEVFRDLSTTESLHRQMLKLLSNFLRCYPDTVSLKPNLATRLGPLLLDMKDARGLARKILDHNKHIFDDA